MIKNLIMAAIGVLLLYGNLIGIFIVADLF